MTVRRRAGDGRLVIARASRAVHAIATDMIALIALLPKSERRAFLARAEAAIAGLAASATIVRTDTTIAALGHPTPAFLALRDELAARAGRPRADRHAAGEPIGR